VPRSEVKVEGTPKRETQAETKPSAQPEDEMFFRGKASIYLVDLSMIVRR
jgi:hypothetical protein